MGKARATFIADILVEHFEEFEFLWGQRRTAPNDPAYTMRELLHLEERIEAHIQGLLVRSEQVLPLVSSGLSSQDPSLAFASAYLILRLGQPKSLPLVLDAFLKAKAGTLDGLREALSFAPARLFIAELQDAAKSAEPPIALAALEVLAHQSPAECSPELLDRFLSEQDPGLRQQAWKIVTLRKPPLVPQRYRKVVEDPAPSVRSQGLWAAAWARQAWLVDHCRTVAKSPKATNRDALQLLAILGGPQDLGLIRDPRWAELLGEDWFDVLGRFGYPVVIPELIRAMENPNPRIAIAASTAFTKMTGIDVASQKRISLPPKNGSTPDAFEEEFLDDAFAPDPAKVREHWKTIKSGVTEKTRWYRGREMGRDTYREILNQLDLPSRRDSCLRLRFETQWNIALADIERFPQSTSALVAGPRTSAANPSA